MTLKAISGVLPTDSNWKAQLETVFSNRLHDISTYAQLTSTHAGRPRRLIFGEYFRLQLGEMIGHRLLIDPLGDFLVAGLFDH